MKQKNKVKRLQARQKAWQETLDNGRRHMSKMRIDVDTFHKPGSLKK